MKEIDSRSRACVVPVAVAASLGMAGMGLVSSGVAVADTTSVTDDINVTVLPSCTFNSTTDKTYTGSAANGTEVNNFNDSGIHEFNLFCNNRNGYTVTATPHNLEATGIEKKISYTDNYTHTGANSMWTAIIASETPGVTVTTPAPVGGGTIISSDSNTTAAGATFTATYKAYVGSETPAGTYTGTIIYTLAATGASNSGNSGSGGAGQNNSGDNSGNTDTDNETTDNTDNDTGSGDANSETPEQGTNSGSPNATPNATPSAAPLAMNNTYNTYNTTNYSSGGTSTPVATNTPSATSGTTSSTTSGTNGDTTSDNGDNGDSETSDSYEKPLGVTTSTSSSKEDPGVDPAPMIVAGVALAVAGTTAVVMARSNKEEE